MSRIDSFLSKRGVPMKIDGNVLTPFNTRTVEGYKHSRLMNELKEKYRNTNISTKNTNVDRSSSGRNIEIVYIPNKIVIETVKKPEKEEIELSSSKERLKIEDQKEPPVLQRQESVELVVLGGWSTEPVSRPDENCCSTLCCCCFDDGDGNNEIVSQTVEDIVTVGDGCECGGCDDCGDCD